MGEVVPSWFNIFNKFCAELGKQKPKGLLSSNSYINRVKHED